MNPRLREILRKLGILDMFTPIRATLPGGPHYAALFGLIVLVISLLYGATLYYGLIIFLYGVIGHIIFLCFRKVPRTNPLFYLQYFLYFLWTGIWLVLMCRGIIW